MGDGRKIKLFVQPHGGVVLTTSGTSGVMPDLHLLGIPDRRCFRSKLPDLSRITYTFGVALGREVAQNFYHMRDFFVMSEQVMKAFLQRFQGDLETSRVQVRCNDGSPTLHPYFATRVKTIIDCIDPEASTWGTSFLKNRR